MVTGLEQAFRPAQIWYIPYPGGTAERITNDLNNYTGVTLTADSSAFVTVQREVMSNIWVTDQAGNSVTYTLDNAGNRVKEDVKDPAGTLGRTITRVFDALGRVQQQTGVAP